DGNLRPFRVGRGLEAGEHPTADRLQRCRVDVGEGEPRQIVCGAWNFGAGATVAVALPGARLPGGLQLDQREVRGEVSDGMILAEDEVELGPDHSGIMVLPEAEPGTPLADVLPLVEEVLLVESLGNPLHAFDHATLHGGRIVVRRAEPGEKLRTLDGVDRDLEPDDLMIADADRSVALAGIMGGEETEIGEQTTEVLLEAANFEPT